MKIAAKVVLAVLLVLGVCGVASAETEGKLYVGWSARDITPDEPVALSPGDSGKYPIEGRV